MMATATDLMITEAPTGDDDSRLEIRATRVEEVFDAHV
jgi:hypothetical protein